jgi:hypothetical protein
MYDRLPSPFQHGKEDNKKQSEQKQAVFQALSSQNYFIIL